MATTNTNIKIADGTADGRCQSRSYSSGPRPSSADRSNIASGVFNTRTLSHQSLDRRSARTELNNHGEEGDEWQSGEQKKKQLFSGRTLLFLAYQSIGVIYGDIGTSPLYVYSSTFTSPPTPSDVLQVLSVVIWTITFMVTIKYVLIILHADNEGEGGTFSCYSLLSRYANITDRDPKEQGHMRIERYMTNDLKPTNRTMRGAIEKSQFTRSLLKIIGVLAVSMVIADGILTPAQTVLGAVQGIRVVNPNITSPTVVGTSCGILILLFLLQPFGTTKLAVAFAPIVIIWLGLNLGFGIYNLVHYDWTVLKAFSPYFAFQFFIHRKTEGWKMLGGILLSFTGVEALFADLGAFSMRAVQISWLGWAYPCLLLAYTGQAAFISSNPNAYSNPFFNAAPPGMLYPSLIVAMLAAIVASQAMITAVFQIVSQIMKLSYCPQVKIVHTSRRFYGQLYVPFLNWLLMCGTILITAVFSDTTRLGHAYGVCVMFVTFFDTCMVTLVALIVWRLPPWVVAVPWLVFACIDGLYLSSALTKVPDGAWFTLTIAAILACVFLLWRFGKENQWREEAEDRFKPTNLIGKNEDGKLHLMPRWGGDTLSNISGFGVFFDKAGVFTPSVFTHFVSKLTSVPDVMVFFHIHHVEMPTVSEGERYAVSRFTTIPGCYRLVVKHGFMDAVITPDLGALIHEQVRKFIIRQAQHVEQNSQEAALGTDNIEPGGEATTTLAAPPASSSRTSEKPPTEVRDGTVAAELAHLDRAYAAKIMYIVGKEQMRIKPGTSILRRILLETFLWIRDNTRAKIAHLRLAMDRVVEIGFVKEI